MSLLRRKHGKQAAKAENHLIGGVNEEAGQSARMSPPPIAIAVLTASTLRLLIGLASPGSTPRRGVKVTKISSEPNSSHPASRQPDKAEEATS
jgi:hypothetical protein